MEPVFGNHLGMVISNNDPEGRKRVQVFIPYLTNTLFADWNNKLKDVTFRTTVDLQKYGVLDRLKQTLPWAEYAAPIFGGATSVTSNSSTGNVEVNNTGTSTFAGFDAMGGVSMVNPNSTALLTSNSEGNKTTFQNSPTIDPKIKELRQRFVKELEDPAKKAWFYSVLEAEVGSQGEQAQIMFAESVMNRIALRNADGIDSIKAYYGPRTQQKMSYSPNEILNNKYDNTIYNTVLQGSNYSNYATGNDQEYDVVNKLVPLGRGLGIETARSGGEIYNIEEADKKRVKAYFGADVDNLGINNIPSVASSNTNVIDSQNDPKNGQAARNNNTYSSASGSPNGTVSVPNESAKVWVFFYGGDIQRPVYFASAIEGST